MAKKKAVAPTGAPKTVAKSPSASATAKKAPKRVPAVKAARRCCGLCGKTTRLTKTECCGHWICDDEDNYVLFSYARNSCHRNHDRYTLCSAHFNEGHAGRWQDCAQCLAMYEPEMYVYYGTNEHNFETLENPPAYEPTTCRKCGKVIRLGEDGYSQSSEGYACGKCSNLKF